MSEHLINLNCTNCGAKLDVYDDLERFACGYCGTELLVQRRGGTVILKSVTEAIKRVQIGTDKTAAELALVRLNQESVKLDEELKKLAVQASGIKGAPILNRGCAVFFAGTVGVMGVGLLSVSFQDPNSSGFPLFLGFVMAAASVVWLITAWTKSTSDKLAIVEKQILEKQAEIDELKRRMVEHRQIVDAAK